MATTAYTDAQTIHNPAVGTAPPAAWGDQIRTNQEFFYRPPMVKLRPTTDTYTITSPHSVLTFAGTVEWDTDSFKTSATKLTVPTGLGGKYLIGAAYQTASSASMKQVAIAVDGTQVAVTSVDGDDTYSTWIQTWVTEDLAAGQEIEALGWAQSSQSWGGTGNATKGFFEMRFVSA